MDEVSGKPKDRCSGRVLIAGIGGASLGTEIFKCLRLTGDYTIFGCDISPVAFGHYQEGLEESFVIDVNRYIENIVEVCEECGIEYIIPGGEQPMVLLSGAEEILKGKGVSLVANSRSVVETFSDKGKGFNLLEELGFRIPGSISITSTSCLDGMAFPCVVKPALDSGGSNFVFLANCEEEVKLYSDHLLLNGKKPIVQEYLPLDEGEFTVGVLSLPDGRIASSIALKRIFNSKLSVSFKSEKGLISSGYSQGYIGDFPVICAKAEEIAKKIGSTGPINVQGRVRNGELIPFEINPRFSASTYLRALAGVNEVEIFLKYLIRGEVVKPEKVKPGYYLRSLSEVFVSQEKVKK